MSLLDKINKDNYNVLITDNKCVIYSGDRPDKGVVISTAKIRDFLYNRPEEGDLSLLYPVTRFFNNLYTKFIVERPPTKVMSINGKEFLIPWHYITVELDLATKGVDNASVYFRPFVPSVEKELLYVFPCPWIDHNAVVYQNIIDLVNDGIDSDTSAYNVIEKLVQTLYNNFDSSNEFQSEFLTKDFDDQDTSDWTFDTFHANMNDMDLEKILYLDYKPFTLKKDKLVVGEGEKVTSFETLIKRFSNDDILSAANFLDLMKQVVA